MRHAVAELEGVTLPPAAAPAPRSQLQRTGTAMLPLRSDQSSDRLIDSAATCAPTSNPAPPMAG